MTDESGKGLSSVLARNLARCASLGFDSSTGKIADRGDNVMLVLAEDHQAWIKSCVRNAWKPKTDHRAV